MQSTQGQELDNVAFEIPLNTVIDCLNIFGTAGPAPSNTNKDNKRWKKRNGGSDNDSGDEGRRIEPISAGTEKHTGLRMTYAGRGYPLTLLMYGVSLLQLSTLLICYSVVPKMPMGLRQHAKYPRMNRNLSWTSILIMIGCMSAFIFFLIKISKSSGR